MNTALKKGLLGLTLLLVLTVGLTRPAGATPTEFRDVPASHWAAGDIFRAVEQGLFSGHKDGSFGMGKPMSRAAFVTALGRLHRWSAATPTNSTFADVTDTTAWYYTAVATALAEGALSGQEKAFRPNDPITREEMAVMLVRSLGYEGLSGLAQSLPLPFQDLTTNPGYIAVAYDLQLMNGYRSDSFAPSHSASREQAAVVLMRLFDKLYAAKPQVSALTGGELATEKPFASVTVRAGRLLPISKEVRLVQTMSAEQQTALRQQPATTNILLGVTGTEKALDLPTEELVAALVAAVEREQWDGLHLDIPQVTQGNQSKLTTLVQALDKGLGGKLLVLTVEAPAWKVQKWGGYDLAALGKVSDQLVLRIGAYVRQANGFPLAPPEPLEEVYYALCTAVEQVGAQKLSLQLTTTGSAWALSNAVDLGTRSASQIQTLLSAGAKVHDSGRFGSAYLLGAERTKELAVWYQSAASVAARMEMAALLGVGHVTLSDGSSIADYEGYSIVSQLWA